MAFQQASDELTEGKKQESDPFTGFTKQTRNKFKDVKVQKAKLKTDNGIYMLKLTQFRK